MRWRFHILAAVCAAWLAALVAVLEPLAALRALERHGPDAALEARPPSNYDFYRANEDVQRDAVLRQRRSVAETYVGDAQARLDLFQMLAILPPLLAFLITALLAWLPETEKPRPSPPAAAPRWSGGRRVR